MGVKHWNRSHFNTWFSYKSNSRDKRWRGKPKSEKQNDEKGQSRETERENARVCQKALGPVDAGYVLADGTAPKDLERISWMNFTPRLFSLSYLFRDYIWCG